MSGPSRPPSYRVRVAEDAADREMCFAVRKEVFVAEQQVPEDIEYDAYDAVAVHVLAVRRTAHLWAPAGCCTERQPRRRPAARRPSAPWAGSR